MSMDFWVVKLKSNLTNNDWNFDNNKCWDLITDEEICDLLPKKLKILC